MEKVLNFDRAARRALFGKEQEIPGAGSSAAKSPGRHTRVKITINLDDDIIEHFKELAAVQGRGYQQLINDALREGIEGGKPERVAQDVGNLLLNDETFLARLAEYIAG
ncbi:MAG: BrnA antitoxin family protein [Bdellovibrionales bacterium]|nr:BrnA antitoxin family protein [Bdellovibrionales bacterium]